MAASAPSALRSGPPGRKNAVDLFGTAVLGIEVAPAPLRHVLAVGMPEISESLEEVKVSRHAATVLRGAGPLTVRDPWSALRIERKQVLRKNIVNPAVPEVVLGDDVARARGVFIAVPAGLEP